MLVTKCVVYHSICYVSERTDISELGLWLSGFSCFDLLSKLDKLWSEHSRVLLVNFVHHWSPSKASASSDCLLELMQLVLLDGNSHGAFRGVLLGEGNDFPL